MIRWIFRIQKLGLHHYVRRRMKSKMIGDFLIMQKSNETMKILYDHQAFSSFAFGGVSRIFFELMNAYSKDPEIMFNLSLKYTDNEYLKNAEWNH